MGEDPTNAEGLVAIEIVQIGSSFGIEGSAKFGEDTIRNFWGDLISNHGRPISLHGLNYGFAISVGVKVLDGQ